MWVLSMSQHSGSVNPLSEHPASPALLTSHGPHGLMCSFCDLPDTISCALLCGHEIAHTCHDPHQRHAHGCGVRDVGWAASQTNKHAQKSKEAPWWEEPRTGEGPMASRAVLKKHAFSVADVYGFATPIHSSRIGRGAEAPQKMPLMRCFTGRNQQLPQ